MQRHDARLGHDPDRRDLEPGAPRAGVPGRQSLSQDWPTQLKVGGGSTSSGSTGPASAPNQTGIPDALKRGLEALSGMSFADVRVHYGSARPAELGALGFTQGNEIHLAPGEERQLAHEAWHVVQQRRGAVKPTVKRQGAAINDEDALEREADTMGDRALAMGASTGPAAHAPPATGGAAGGGVIQLRFNVLQRGQLMAVPQIAGAQNPNGVIDFLRDHTTRSVADLIQMMAWTDQSGARLTAPQFQQLDRFAAVHLTLLNALPQIQHWADAAQLAAGTRSALHLLALAGVQLGGRVPSLAEMVALDRFTNDEINNLRALPQAASWPAMVQLAGGTRSAADLILIAAMQLGGQRATTGEMLAMDRFSAADVGHLGGDLAPRGQVDTWAAFGQLAGLTRSVADLRTLSALQCGGRVPSRPEIVAVDRLAIGDLQALVALPNITGWPDVVQLAAGTRSGPDLRVMAAVQRGGRVPTVAEMVALNRFTNTELGTLVGIPQAPDWPGLIRLAGGTRSAADLVLLAAMQPGGQRPSVPEMATLDRFSNADVTQLGNDMAPRGQIDSWAAFGQIAGLTRSVADLRTLSALQSGGRVPTRPEIIAIDRLAIGDLQALVARPNITSWPHVQQLAAGTRTGADLRTLSALQVAGALPTVAELAGVEGQTLVKIQTLQAANLAQVTTWDHLRQLAVLNRDAATTIGRANTLKAGARPSLAELVAIDRFNDAEVTAVRTLNSVNSWAQTQSALTNLPELMMQIVQSQAGTLNGDLAELQGTLGRGDIDLWHYAAVLVDVNCPQIGAAAGGFGALTAGEQRQLMTMYFTDCTSYNACFDGANRLVDAIGTENLGLTYNSGGGIRQEYNLVTQGQRVVQLNADMAAAAATGTPMLFRIHFGGHGFDLSVEGNDVFQLETLAGSAEAGTLLRSIQHGYRRARANVAQNFIEMASNSVVTRTHGAGEMNWNAGPLALLQKSVPHAPAYDQVKDPMTVYWTGAPLATRDQLVQRFTQKIQANRAAILQKLRA